MPRCPKKHFAVEEKQILVNYVRDNRLIIENKANDVTAIKARKQKWQELSELLAANGYYRDWQRLREYYHRMKCSAKSTIAAYHKLLKDTGIIPDQTPNETDWAIYEICPDDFKDVKEDENDNNEFSNVKTEKSDNIYIEDVSLDSESGYVQADKFVEPILNESPYPYEKRKPIYNHSAPKKRKSNRQSVEIITSNEEKPPITESDVLEHKMRLELELHTQLLEFSRAKHMEEMETTKLIQQKLKIEMETAILSKLKMEKEVERMDLELAQLRSKINSSS